MLNQRSLSALAAATCGPDGCFRRPLPDTYSFARIPTTIEYLLTGASDVLPDALPADCWQGLDAPFQTVVLLFVDGFGWHAFQRHRDMPFLQRLLHHGVVSPITSQFPSTTAAHVTTIHTGQPVGRSGIIEWYYYEPVADAVICPLKYSLAGDPAREGLRGTLKPEEFLPEETFYQRLAKRGVESFVIQHQDYTPSTYSNHVFRGATVVPFATPEQALDELADLCGPRADAQPRYVFVYLDAVDSHSHMYGPEGPVTLRLIEQLLRLFEEKLSRMSVGRRTLLAVTADHGQTPIDPTRAVYVNFEVPGIERFLRLTRRGEPIRFGGSNRDLFLYVKPECQDELHGELSERLKGVAEVWRVKEMIEAGFFGPLDPERLFPRLGDLVVLPHEGEAVFWFQDGRFQVRNRGSHGGLTPLEMDTGLYLLPLG